jgi:hypothetical protein
MIILSFFLIASIALNIVLIWYIRQAIQKLFFVSDNMGEFAERMKEYEGHLDLISKMETYYGDEIIENLLKHTQAIVKEVKSYQTTYNLTHEVDDEQVVEEMSV